MRMILDRESLHYRAMHIQSTSYKVRNGRSVANLNTLIYLSINVRALNRVTSINRGLLQMNFVSILFRAPHPFSTAACLDPLLKRVKMII